MNNSNNTSFWRHWFNPTPPLPSHLPRLLLAKQCQPRFVRQCLVTQRLMALLQLVDWEQLPTTLTLRVREERTIPLAAYIGAYLVKLEHQLPTFGALRRFLREHPALIWALGFPLVNYRPLWGTFDVDASLPTQRHFSRKLRFLPNELLQNLLDSQVGWLQQSFGDDFGQTISIDTKHIVGWVRENNPKAYIEDGRFHKDQQPAGDPDCKLGCKRRKNQTTPTKEGETMTEKVSVGEYYWGYASGVVATKVADVGEFVLAEVTQTFDHADATYFFPLMQQVEPRLGFRPRYATADAAFDGFYIYDYFHSDEHDGFAAVPLRLTHYHRHFSEDGVPLCEANLPMFQKGTFTNRSSLVQHKRGRYWCPLLHPEQTADSCPIDHPKWTKDGCKTTFPLVAGARIRYQLDRDSDRYQEVYAQRTAVERIFSQAVNLGIERPKLRNRQAIANQNTLIYILINLRAMVRVENTTK